ncbi:MAG: heavy metal sensor histidine kinase [Planctomycetales bacterium]
MKRPTIRWKLTLWYAGVLAVVLTLFSGVVYFTMRHQLLGRIDQGLDEELADVLSEVDRAGDSAGMLKWLHRRFAHHEGFDFEITDAHGRRVFVNPRLVERGLSFAPASTAGSTRSSPAGSTSQDAEAPRLETRNVGSAGWRIVTVEARGPDGPLTVRVARSLASFEHEMRELLLTFLLVAPLTLLAAVGGGYVLADRALRPVQEMSRTARRITADRLHERIAVDNPHDELGTLAVTLNEMIERLERSFTEMQRFTADAAHELRTPLAVIRNEAEVALRSARSPEEYCRVLENLLEETDRLSTMADQLLFLCRQDAGLQPKANGSVPMAELLADVVSNMQLVAQDKRVVLSLQEDEPCLLTGDGRQLRRLFYNLLDNAIKYTSAGGRVSVTSRREADSLIVVVADTGIGIPVEHLPRIFDRFYRIDPARSDELDGAGLGLSICCSIVRGMGGKISVESAVGRGTKFTVRLELPEASETQPHGAGTV